MTWRQAAWAWMVGGLVLTALARSADDLPATQPAGRFEATDTAALKAAAGQRATVHGTVWRASWYQDRILFINFRGVDRNTGFTAIARKPAREALDAAFGGDIAAAIEGQTIEVTGTLVIYRDKPEIEITRPQQLRIIQAKPAP